MLANTLTTLNTCILTNAVIHHVDLKSAYQIAPLPFTHKSNLNKRSRKKMWPGH